MREFEAQLIQTSFKTISVCPSWVLVVIKPVNQKQLVGDAEHSSPTGSDSVCPASESFGLM